MSNFVYDPYFFSNITDESFGERTFGRIYYCNYIASSICGFFIVPPLLYIIVYKSPPTLHDFKKILLGITTVDLVFWIMYLFGQLRIRYVNELSLRSFAGPILWWTSPELQMVAYVFYINTFFIPFVILPLPFWYRDQMLRNRLPSNCSLMRFVGLMFLIIISVTFCTANAVLETDRTKDYSSQWFVEVPIPPLMVTNKLQGRYAAIYDICAKLITFGALLVTAYIALQSYRFLKTEVREVRRSRVMDQFTRLIFAQMLVPTFILVTPLVILIALSMVRIEHEVIHNFFPLIFAWIPSINSIATLIIIVPYRQIVISKLKRITGFSHSNVIIINATSI
ncbi:hypothetical protein M3Y95_01127600 [Aphelenchoides besseyi]|nr:hypothetical protein M3Y95_01127600 [Aphelenchoides besseyi]